LIRFPDWEQRLGAFLDEIRDRPFDWGRHDCCLMAAGGVIAMTGEDPMPEFRGRYRTKRGAACALNRYGAGTLAATMDGKFGAIAPALAFRGDIVMVEGGLGISLGSASIHVGELGEREGLILRPRLLWTHAWRVPMPGADA